MSLMSSFRQSEFRRHHLMRPRLRPPSIVKSIAATIFRETLHQVLNLVHVQRDM